MSANRYLDAARRIPRGETRTFLELAAMAGRPGAARAAGRALAACPADGPVPWHRVVAADGSLARKPQRAHEQLARLRREGGRPREEESVIEWALRRRVPLVGHLPNRCFVPVDQLGGLPWKTLEVEAIRDEATALSRGLLPMDRHPETQGGSLRADPPPRPRRRPAAPPMEERIRSIDWAAAMRSLRKQGLFHSRALLSAAECADLAALWDRPGRFDRAIEMGPRGYGVGAYRYFREPLPRPLLALRRLLYARLRKAADDLRARAPGEPRYPPTLAAFWRRCREAGQHRASTILLRYGAGGINHPHRDIYGREWFPFQALLLLSAAGRDFDGGEFALLEEHRGDGERWREVAVSRGDLVVFCSQHRWEERGGRRRKVSVRHAMNMVRRGERRGIGIVFHLAE